MKKLISTFCIYLILSSNAWALFGAGDIVSDPTSYTYYVEQIKQATEQLENLQEQLETAKNIYGEVEDMRKQLIGAYDQATGMVNDLSNIREEIENNPTAMAKYAKKFLSHEMGDDDFVDPRVLIEGIFKDPRMPQEKVEKLKTLNEKYHARQKTLEDAITESEKTLNGMPERYELLEDLAGRIDSTPNVKAAMDLNNRILAEILKILTDHLALVAHIGEAQSIVNFDGATDEATAQREQEIEENIEKSSEYAPLQEYLDANGIDTSKKDDSEFYKILGIEQ